MKQLFYRVVDCRGLHVRPAFMISKCLKESKCNSFIEYHGKIIQGKNRKELLGLEVPYDGEVVISICGETEEQTMLKLKSVLNDWEKGKMRL